LDGDGAGWENERNLLDNLSVTVSDIVVQEDVAICVGLGARSSTFAEALPQMHRFATETEKYVVLVMGSSLNPSSGNLFIMINNQAVPDMVLWQG